MKAMPENNADEHSFGGNWTLIKLDVIEKYLSAFNTALSRQGFTRIYIDAFAGTGRCDVKIDGQKKVIDGSARIALTTTPPFDKFYFIENDPKKVDILKNLCLQHKGKDIDVIQGDANQALKDLCNQFSWVEERAVLFLDPYGMNVEWSTLEMIANTKAIDVWYLFPFSAFYRQTPKNANAIDLDKSSALNRLLGTDEWRRVFYKENPQSDLFTADSGDVRDWSHTQMLDYFSHRLGKVFSFVEKPKILYQKGDSGPPLFALYFAVSNPSQKAYSLASKIANHILNAR